ncbi:uncharacterized protein LOC135271067 [Aotus nancymaae]|uniref:uncharacterized protein LOC135271067 n=1 Tax=Aotus nancymaae TaxID=37293 RepID=UPI0030FEC893
MEDDNWKKNCIPPAVPGPVASSQVPSTWCAEALALPVALVSCTDLVNSSAQVGPVDLSGIVPISQVPALGALKLRPFLALWSLAQSCVSSSAQVGPLALTRINGEPRGRLALGPVSLGLCPSATCPAPGALKLRSFLTPWSPALSCVSSSVQVILLSPQMVSPEEDLHWPVVPRAEAMSQVLRPYCTKALVLPGALVSCMELTSRP